MKKLLAFLLILTLIAGLAACANEPEVVEPDIPEELEIETPDAEAVPIFGSNINGALHRIEYGDNVVYLFGTLHGGRAQWYPLADVVEDALRRADVLAMEVDLTDTETLEDAVMDAMFLPDGQTWADFLPQEAYEHLIEVASLYGLSYEESNTIHPTVLVTLITLELAQELAVNFEMTTEIGSVGVDGYLAGIALELGLPIIGLESIEQQVDIAYNPPLDVVIAQVMHLLPPDEMIEAILENMTMDQMADCYEANNFNALNRGFAQELDPQSDRADLIYMREMVSNWRSTYYATEIARLLQETEEPTTFFVAVGLSHVIRSGAGDGFTDIVEQLALLNIRAVPVQAISL